MQQKIVSQTAQKQSSLIVTMTLVTRHLCSPRNDGISETTDNLRFKKMRSMDTDRDTWKIQLILNLITTPIVLILLKYEVTSWPGPGLLALAFIRLQVTEYSSNNFRIFA